MDIEKPGFLKKPGFSGIESSDFLLDNQPDFSYLIVSYFSEKMLIDRGAKMHIASFETQVMPDGHLFCPPEFRNKQNIRFVVLLIEDKEGIAASDHDIEMASVHDVSNDFLSEKELNYYMNLEEL